MKKILLLSLLALGYALSFNLVLAAYGSQCKTGQGNGEKQGGCIHDNDSAILSTQCAQYYSGSCSNMQSYLSAMSVDCSQINPSGIDCSMITQNGIYGREASKFANYIEENGLPGDPIPPDDDPCTTGSGFSLAGLDCLNIPKSSIAAIILKIMLWLLFIVGFLSIIGFTVSGILYITSAGDDERTKKAKDILFYSIIGTIVAISGLIIVKFIFNALSGTTSYL